jgi:peptidoglycan/xylan/chitin deacetylase (PgdA/CDA1 family)
MQIIVAAVAAAFMYHHVAPSAPNGPYARALTVSPQEFAQQLSWLRRRGCALVRASQLVHDARDGRLAACEVALTFDDGYADASTIAAPLLVEDGAVGTFFIATGVVGTPGHVSVAQVRSLNEEGMELGAHTVHHADLTLLSASARAAEIGDSIAALQSWTKTPVTDFAYPAGRYDSRVEAALARAGVGAAFTTQPGRIGPTATADVFALPRYRVLHGSGIALFRSVLGLGTHAGPAVPSQAAIASIARERAEGNDAPVAELIGARLLQNSYPEPIEKVRVLNVPPATVAGIMLSGRGLHAPVTPDGFETDARDMAATALAAAPNVGEVDVWAVVPQPVPAGATVAGDLAVPTDRTVFSIAVRRGGPPSRSYIDAAWAADLKRRNRAWRN